MKNIFIILFLITTLLSSGQGTSCGNAINIPLNNSCATFSVSSTLGNAGVVCNYIGTNGRVTYFKFTSSANPNCIEINFSASTTIEILDYDHCPVNNNNNIPSLGLCIDNGNGIWATDYSNLPQPNKTYYLEVHTGNNYTDTIRVCGKYYTPPNDLCTGATPIDSNIISDNNACHTPNGGNIIPQQSCALSFENTAWYSYTVAQTGISIINISNINCVNNTQGGGTAGAGFQIGFFAGTCANPQWLSCQTDTADGNGFVQFTSTSLPAGTHVYVSIDGTAGANCSYGINAFNALGILSLRKDIIHERSHITVKLFGDIWLYNMLGQVLYQGRGRNIDVPIDHLPHGVYMLILNDGRFNRTYKFVK